MLEEAVGSDSLTAQAIVAYEEYARAHLPRLVEEALETTVAEQTQPIEESLRRTLAGIVRDSHARLAQNSLQHRSSNLSNAGVPIETLPIVLHRASESYGRDFFVRSKLHLGQREGSFGPQTDSGYDGSDSYGLSSNSKDVHNGNEIMLEDCDWAAILEKRR